VIAIDRYSATFYPIWYRTQNWEKRTALYVATVWIVSTLTSIPPLFGFGTMTKRSYSVGPLGVATCEVFDNIDFVMYSSAMTFIVPAVVLIVLYGKIFLEIKRRLV